MFFNEDSIFDDNFTLLSRIRNIEKIVKKIMNQDSSSDNDYDANITVDNTTGTPSASVEVTQNNNTITFNFSLSGVKGEKGANGLDGATGATGNGIESVVKTGSDGLVDTYTITFTDNSTTTFTVTNGENGIAGANGRGISSITKTGSDGLVDTYTILYTDNSTTTFTVTNGENGSGSDIYAYVPNDEGSTTGGNLEIIGISNNNNTPTLSMQVAAEEEESITSSLRGIPWGFNYVPSGNTGDVLTILSNGYGWSTPQGGSIGGYVDFDNESHTGNIQEIWMTKAGNRQGFSLKFDGEDNQRSTFFGGIPYGGSTGQTIVKNSNNDFDYVWEDVSNGWKDLTSAAQAISGEDFSLRYVLTTFMNDNNITELYAFSNTTGYGSRYSAISNGSIAKLVAPDPTQLSFYDYGHPSYSFEIITNTSTNEITSQKFSMNQITTTTQTRPVFISDANNNAYIHIRRIDDKISEYGTYIFDFRGVLAKNIGIPNKAILRLDQGQYGTFNIDIIPIITENVTPYTDEDAGTTKYGFSFWTLDNGLVGSALNTILLGTESEAISTWLNLPFLRSALSSSANDRLLKMIGR